MSTTRIFDIVAYCKLPSAIQWVATATNDLLIDVNVDYQLTFETPTIIGRVTIPDDSSREIVRELEGRLNEFVNRRASVVRSVRLHEVHV